MFNSTMLDVAVGLVFVYLMLSVACAAINERIQAGLSKRSHELEHALQQLLHGIPSTGMPGVEGAINKTLCDDLYSHFFVRSLATVPGKKPSYIPSRSFSLALFDTLAPIERGKPASLETIRGSIAALPPSATRNGLLKLVDHSEGDLDKARANVERWFDDSMDRLSGAYKRHIQWWLLGLGLVLAIVTNADSISLAMRMQHNGALRNAVTAQAARVDTAASHVEISDKELQKLDLLFWDAQDWTSDEATPRAWRSFDYTYKWVWWGFLKLLGLLITAVAITMGAPFWFDVLNKLVNLRSTGAKPETAAAIKKETPPETKSVTTVIAQTDVAADGQTTLSTGSQTRSATG